jgi:hypothetical protein
MNSLYLFQRGSENPLLDLNLAPISEQTVAFFAILIALLLGHTIYTDIHRGRVIRNWTTLLIGAVAVVGSFFIYEDILAHYLMVLAALAVLFVLAFIGAFKMGDIKLYLGLSIALGKAVFPLMMISWIVIILYSIPIMRAKIKENKKNSDKEPRGMRLGTAPGGPGIAIAFPLTLYMIGIEWWQALALLAIEGIGYLISQAIDPRIWPNDDVDDQSAQQAAS